MSGAKGAGAFLGLAGVAVVGGLGYWFYERGEKRRHQDASKELWQLTFARLDVSYRDADQTAHYRRLVDKLVEVDGADLLWENPDQNYLNVLQLACCLNDPDAVLVLLDTGRADVNHGDSQRGQRPLHVSANAGAYKIVQLLVDRGARVDETNLNAETPLYCACEKGKPDIVAYLLANGANPNAKCPHNYTPLHKAVFQNNVECVRILLSNGGSTHAQAFDRQTPLHVAAANGCTESVRLLVQSRADLGVRDEKGRFPIEYAVIHRHLDCVNALLEFDRRAPHELRTADGQTLLHLAAALGHTEIVDVLLEHGAPVDARTSTHQTALQLALLNGQHDVVPLLLRRGASPNLRDQDGRSPVFIAANANEPGLLELLLRSGGENEVVEMQWTLLHKMALLGYDECARVLVEHGVHLDAKNDVGNTALHLAAQSSLACARLLVEAGACINAVNQKLMTPLHVAAIKGNSSIVKYLLSQGADVNARNASRSTPLHLSSSLGDLETMRALVKHKANRSAVDEFGNTPYDYAQSHEARELLMGRSSVGELVQ